jgi:hypothetical protein
MVGDYTELSNDNHIYQWYASTIVTARILKLGDVINPYFVPTPVMYEVFQEKNIFFHSVLQKTLFTSCTKVHIRMYAKTSDGQKVFAALVIDFTTGLEGNLRVDSLKINLNYLKLDSSWDSTCFAFIAAWKHKIFDLENKMQVSEADTRSWLMGALKPHPALYIAINHMRISQAIAKLPNFTFYEFVEAI